MKGPVAPEDRNVNTVARNHPCPCGSGKKYKLCCLGRKEAAEREAYQARIRERLAAARAPQTYRVLEEDPLDALSNRANHLIGEGHLEAAEQACRQLLDEYPDYIDGHERTAQLLEARGDHKGAAESLRKALDMALTQDGFEEASYAWMRNEIARLER